VSHAACPYRFLSMGDNSNFRIADHIPGEHDTTYKAGVCLPIAGGKGSYGQLTGRRPLQMGSGQRFAVMSRLPHLLQQCLCRAGQVTIPDLLIDTQSLS
jgi:hypothetical protein